MTSEEQEARSRKFLGWWVVPLESGRFAVWPHPMSESPPAIVERLALREREPEPEQPTLPGLDLEGIDL